MQFRVYVLELDDGSLYVGSTGHDIKARVAQHRAKTNLSARLFRTGKRLIRRIRWDLCPAQVYVTRLPVEAAERICARRLSKTHKVHQK
jgi:hypothetical protein